MKQPMRLPALPQGPWWQPLHAALMPDYTQLRGLGCGDGQGFHMAQPLSDLAAGAWLCERCGQLH